jgi:hypothetical protein
MPIYLIRAGDGPVRLNYSGRPPEVALRIVQRYHWETLRIVGTLRSASKRLPWLAKQFASNALGNGWFVWSEEIAALASVVSKLKWPRGRRPSPHIETIKARILAGGETLTDISKDYNLTRERIRQIAMQIGVSGRDLAKTLPPRPLTPRQIKMAEHNRLIAERRKQRKALYSARVARAVELLDGGMKRKQIASAMKLDLVLVSRLLIAGGRRHQKRGVQNPRPPHPPPPKNPTSDDASELLRTPRSHDHHSRPPPLGSRAERATDRGSADIAGANHHEERHHRTGAPLRLPAPPVTHSPPGSIPMTHPACHGRVRRAARACPPTFPARAATL